MNPSSYFFIYICPGRNQPHMPSITCTTWNLARIRSQLYVLLILVQPEMQQGTNFESFYFLQGINFFQFNSHTTWSPAMIHLFYYPRYKTNRGTIFLCLLPSKSEVQLNRKCWLIEIFLVDSIANYFFIIWNIFFLPITNLKDKYNFGQLRITIGQFSSV